MPNILKWTMPADYVPNLSTARIATRPSKYHGKKDRPPVFKSVAALNREIDFVGCTSKCNVHLEYNGQSLLKVFFVIKWMQDAPVDNGAALVRITEEVITPVIGALFTLTGHSQVADEIVVEQCHTLCGDRWKASFRVIFPDFCCTASNLSAMADALDLPSYIDRSVFTGLLPINGLIHKVPSSESTQVPRLLSSTQVLALQIQILPDS